MTATIVQRNRLTIPTAQQMHANVLACYELATRAEWLDGFAWYDRANELAHDVGHAMGIPADRIACMLATASPSCKWEQQALQAQAQAQVIISGLPLRMIPGHPLTGAQRTMMQSVVLNGPACLTGRKRIDFAGAILGDKLAAPIDAHMVRALLGQYIPYKDTSISSDAQYEQMHGVVCAVARSLGMYPARLQAIVWTVARNRSKQLDLH